MNAKKYASDVTDSQWEIIKSLQPKAGNKRKWKKRELINAVLENALGKHLTAARRRKAPHSTLLSAGPQRK